MRIVFTALISALFLSIASCNGNKYRSCSGTAWGTMFHITYSATADLSDSIFAEMERVDNSLSMFNPMSLVSAVNSGKCFRVDPYMADVLKISKEVNILSGGAFDPTVAPLVELWGFGPGRRDSMGTPSRQEIDSALQLVGISGCRVAIDGALVKKHPLTRFDFSAIAKGYGIDRIASMLRRNGSGNFMVEIGGEVVLAGVNPRGKAWRIQIDAPTDFPDAHESLTIRPFGPALTAIASSGNYRNFRTDSLGQRYGHTISPKTGRPFQSDVIAATVISPDGNCARADALATAAMAMNAAEATEMLRKAGVSAILVTGDTGHLKTIEIKHPDSIQTPSGPNGAILTAK